MVLDYFRSVPSRLQQRGLAGLAADQGEIDAEEQRRKEEEERRRQLEEARKAYEQSTADAMGQAQQHSLRGSLLDQARERFDDLTGGIGQTVGQGFSDLGTAVSEAPGRAWHADDVDVSQPVGDAFSALGTGARGLADEAGRAVSTGSAARALGPAAADMASTAGRYGDWRAQQPAEPEPPSAWERYGDWRERVQGEDRGTPFQDWTRGQVAGMRAESPLEEASRAAERQNRTSALTGGYRPTPEKEAYEAYLREHGGLPGALGRRAGAAAAGALGTTGQLGAEEDRLTGGVGRYGRGQER